MRSSNHAGGTLLGSQVGGVARFPMIFPMAHLGSKWAKGVKCCVSAVRKSPSLAVLSGSHFFRVGS
jgi:hypothetical protein